MIIGFALYKYFPYGGLQRDFLRIALTCQQRGHVIRAYVREWQGEVPDGIEVYRMSAKGGLSNPARNQYYTRWLESSLRENPVDLLVGFNKMPGLDIYYAADGCFLEKAQHQRSWLYRKTRRFRHFLSYEKAVFAVESRTEILMISSLQKPVFQKHYGTPNYRIHMLPPGISRDRCAPTASEAERMRRVIRHEFSIDNEALLLLAVGSGFKTKGLDRSIRALAQLPESVRQKTHLLVVGDDKEKPFKRLADRLQVSQQVIFCQGRRDVPELMQAADVLIHPAYHENTGTVLLEALVSGLPVLTTDICGYAHYIKEAKAGVVLDSPFLQEDMNHKLADILTSTVMPSWRANALAFVSKADIYRLPECAVDIIEACLKRKRTSLQQ